MEEVSLTKQGTMRSHSNANLRPYHTYSIQQFCKLLVEVSSVDDLMFVYKNPEWQHLPKLMIGKGSNMLFTERFDGIAVVNRLIGKKVTESRDAWRLHIHAGEDWPSLVAWSVEQGFLGLENLALIPGCAGSAPIQNIDAYGVALEDVCEYVDILCLETFHVKRLKSEECQFGYRDSIFKHQLYQKAVIVAIGLKLPKNWTPNIEYGPLQSLNARDVTAKQIFELVSKIRREKLPDPRVMGNAGSFFKNPVVSQEQCQTLSKQYPSIAKYPVADGVKIAAGWLIENCGLKGTVIGGAQVHPTQASVIVNKDNASGEDVVKLASMVRKEVLTKYGIELEHEVRIMGRLAETNLKEMLEQAHKRWQCTDDVLNNGVARICHHGEELEEQLSVPRTP